MNMKRLLSLVAFFATLQASAQQVNPVPDYVFANRMSAGRNTVTDTAAYFSIGPRYGATRGMMPPMVVDTSSFSGNKRNGLLIFSVQKNKFLYWDSVGVKWAEMAGTAGTALTSADTAALLSTRAWRQKGIDSLAAIRIGGSGTANYIPKFTGTTTIGNSTAYDNSGELLVGTTSDAGSYRLQVSGATYVAGNIFNTTSAYIATSSGGLGIGTQTALAKLDIRGAGGQSVYMISTIADDLSHSLESYRSTGGSWSNFTIKSQNMIFSNASGSGSQAESGRITASGEFLLNSTATDAGDYKLQVAGNIYNTGSLTTGAPSGGSIKPWKIGEAATVSPTSPNRTLRVEVDGVVYYIHAKTTND